jgi:hypothetical protein
MQLTVTQLVTKFLSFIQVHYIRLHYIKYKEYEATYKNKYMCTEQGRTLTFWVPELYQVREATKFIFIIDNEGHIKIKGEADITDSITANIS